MKEQITYNLWIVHGHGYPTYATSCLKAKPRIVLWLNSWICMIKQALINKERGFYNNYYKKYAVVSEAGWRQRYVLYNKTLLEFDLIQHQISFARSGDVRLSFALPSITCPSKTNLMLDSVSSNKCLLFEIFSQSNWKFGLCEFFYSK